jgi:DNA-binding CsgD family transcriptional regulator
MGNLPEVPDVWAPVGAASLPKGLAAAFESEDWPLLRRELSTVMDGAITDGIYGRELLQFVLRLPAGIDPVLDRYRAMAMLDHGDWDGIRATLPSQSIEPLELQRKTDIITAPVDRTRLPETTTVYQRLSLEIMEYPCRNAATLFRHWAQRISGVSPEALWVREDVPIGRHLRYRQLQDTTLLAVAESQAGRLPVAHALASEATRLGDEGEPLRLLARDISELVRRALGDNNEFELMALRRICESTGPSPLGAGEMIRYQFHLLPLCDDDSLEWAARIFGHIASRFASPRWQLQADAWKVASELRSGKPSSKTELAGLAARARRSSAGLKALPTFLQGFTQRNYELLGECERLARQSGNVWLQISAMAWMTALDPRAKVAKRLRQLLEVTGWRRLVLLPSEIAADAALGMTSLGERSDAILDMALIADRPNVTTELIARYIDDPKTPQATRLSAVNALGRVGTTHAREILARLAQRRDDVGKAAAKTAEGPTYGLSEREIEVLSLAADGLTNKQIGEKLFLSPHTIARHLANARAKLGASNRAEAAVRLHRAGID